MQDEDPIAELHRIRQKIYKEAGGTPESLIRYLMKQQKKYADRLVDLSKPESGQKKTQLKPAKPAAKTHRRKADKQRKVAAP